MLPPSDPRWWRFFLGYLLFAGLLALALTPLYFLAEPTHRPLVVRLGATLLAVSVLVHLRRFVRAAITSQPASAFDRALRPLPPERHIAPLFLKLRNELRFSRADFGYFQRNLWPRILRLSRRRVGGSLSKAPEMPRGGFFRRGPSLAAFRQLISQIEERP